MDKLAQLVTRMTLEEKVGQMTQLSIDTLHVGEPLDIQLPPQIDEAKLDRIIREEMVGSILNVPSGYLPDRKEWIELIAKIQEKAKTTRLGIPVLYGIDAIHGVNYCRDATLFPQPIAMAASFNRSLTEQVASATAYECRAAHLPWNFSPALDVGRHPAWPRLWESFGEDVYVNGQMGQAMVKGYQGTQHPDPFKVAACLKHFVAYGQPLSGMDRSPAWVPERQLREYYLPAFQNAIDAGAMTIMVNSGEINGIPVHANRRLLTDILRDEMGFEGLLVTDWWDIVYLHQRHKVAPDLKTAVRLAIEAGVDMSMTPFDTEFKHLLVELVQEGSISETRIDASVARILNLKEKLGLFEQTFPPEEGYPDFGSQRFHKTSKKAAQESIVLLKNQQQLLPIPKDANILVCGPAANTMQALNGGWTADWQGESADTMLKDYANILQAVEGINEGTVHFHEGVSFEKELKVRDAIWKAQEVDYIILCLGEASYTEEEGNIQDLYIDEIQTNLALALAETGKPIILVLAEGRPRLISKFADRMNAIIGAFYPGPYGGVAIAEIIFGLQNPSGKLPFTYPRFPNALLNYDHKHTEDWILKKTGPAYNPQFEFGHGLSYSDFKYTKLSVSKTVFSSDEMIEIEVSLTNKGLLAGKETILLFISDVYASISPPVKRLRGFHKIELEPGEEKKHTFRIQPNALSFIDKNMDWGLEPGQFIVRIGDLHQAFEII